VIGSPYSPGLLFGDTLCVSGQLGRNSKIGQYPEEFDAEVKGRNNPPFRV